MESHARHRLNLLVYDHPGTGIVKEAASNGGSPPL